MTWLVVLIITLNDQSQAVRWAMTPDLQTCIITGGGVASFMEAHDPRLTVRFTCRREVPA